MKKRSLACFALAFVATLAATASSAPAAQPLVTAVFEPEAFGSGASLAFARSRDAGATAVRLSLAWSSVAPDGEVAPDGFDATDPASPSYRWAAFDQQVRSAVDAHLAPIIAIVSPPEWALVAAPGSAERTLPDPVALGRFALAAARRYSGGFGTLPHARFWQVWNEPNISLFLAPQFLNGLPFSPGWYRAMVNEVADSVKSVHADNFVIAGGTAPFFDNTAEVMAHDPDWGPLSFARHVLCLSEALTPTCDTPVRFDIWAHNPYSSGGPTRHAVLPNDVSIGDLPELRAVLTAGKQAGHVLTDTHVLLWVTEFSWDSSPPDPNGVPEPLLSRWVAESMFRMWESGVSLVTWFLLRDFPLLGHYHSGLYSRGATIAQDQPKPHLQAFRFPFVAFPVVGGVQVWGRTPVGRQATVVVQQQFKGGWADLGTLTSDEYGVVQGRLPGRLIGSVRARTVDLGELSAPFSPRLEPDRTYHPFGGVQLEPDPPPPPPPPAPVLPVRPDVPGTAAPAPAPPPAVPPRPAR